MNQLSAPPNPISGIPSQSNAITKDQKPQTWNWVDLLYLFPVLFFAGWLRIWGLAQNSYGNGYYAAAVRSMLVNPTNFFFGAYDPVGVVTVDKPPVALWVQAISAKIFGFSGLSLLIPQGLMGVVTVGILFFLLRPWFGRLPSLMAAFLLAITPIGIAVDRDNLPDSLLTLLLVLAAWAIQKSCTFGQTRWLFWSMVLVGIGFNVKMLAAFVVLPTFYMVYFFGSPLSWKRRVLDLVAATFLLFSVSLSWALVVEIYPKDKRPYIGGSSKNSAMELALGYNGIGRVFGGSGNPGMGGRPPGQSGNNPVGMGPAGAGAPGDNSADGRRPGGPSQSGIPEVGPEGPDGNNGPPRFPGGPGGFPGGPGGFPGGPGGFPGGPGMGGFPGGPGMGFGPPGGPGMGGFPGGPGMGGFPGGPGMGFGPPGGPGGMPGFGGTPGVFRFAATFLGMQITWLFPLAFLGTIAFLVIHSGSAFWKGNWSTQSAMVFLWAGWLATHWVVFSFARGIFHDYYTIIMGPAVAALVGIGLPSLVYTMREPNWRQSLLPMGICLGAMWQAYLIGSEGFFKYNLVPAILAIAGIASFMILWSAILGHWFVRIPWKNLGAALGVSVLLVGPGVWSVGTTLSPGLSVLPRADVSGLIGNPENLPRFPGPMMNLDLEGTDKMVRFLKANQSSETILLAGQSSMEMSGLIILSGEPIISIGGFNGGDAIFSKDQFVSLVEEGKLRFFQIGGGPGGGPPGGGPRGGGRGNGPGGFPDGNNPGMGGPGGPPGMGGPGGPGSANREILDWVRENGKLVDSPLWQNPPKSSEEVAFPFGPMGGGPMGGGPIGRGAMGMGRELYDLKPGKGLIDPSLKDQGQNP